ncbi:MAG: cyclase family protein [Bryobacteraceae bacterium]
MSGWIDISVPVETGMVHWPGDPAVSVDRMSDMDRGDICNVRSMSMSAHTGTHMDAPLHFLRNGDGIDTMPLDATIGRARVIAIEDPKSIGRVELERHEIQPGERILFRTANSAGAWGTRCFLKSFVHVDSSGAEYLAGRHVQTVGVDYLSVGAYQGDGVETHQILLRAGIWIIEGLNLSGVDPGEYELCCLPLRIAGGDGAPARAVLRKTEGRD